MITACAHCETPLPDGSRFCPTCGADSSDPGSGPRTGATSSVDLGRMLRDVVTDHYEIQDLLGQGGMGAVFLAHDRKLDRQVAIKVLPPELARDAHFVGRFQREARTAAKLDHPGIIPIYAVESEGELHYFVMKYVTGRGLDAVIASGAVPIDLAQRVLWEAAVALGHAHSRGVVHRDIKPANIMIDDAGRVVLTDFGISKALQSVSEFTATGQVIGTPHYMSPEQAKGGEIGGASDQYSLGVVGYRMLTGRLPFEDGSVHTIIYKHVFEDPAPVDTLRPDAPGFFAAALRRAMAKDPSHRFATMEALATAVWPEHPVEPDSRESAGMGVRRSITSTDAPTEMSGPTVVASRRRRRRLAPAVLTMVALTAAVVAMFAFTPYGQTLLERAGLLATASPAIQDTPQVAPPDSQALVLANPAAAESTVVPPDTARAAPIDTPAPATPRPAPPIDRPAQPRPATPAPPRSGFLTVSATPYGTLYVDDAFIGDTPQVRLELTVGRHIIEVRREGYRTIVDTVNIVAGEESRLSKILARSGG